MANISQYLAAIMSAIYGRDVRSSIYDAIFQINKAQEEALNAGTAINAGDPAGGVYDKSLYFNTSTNELLECNGTSWVSIDNLEGNAITSITGPTTSGLVDTYTINFSKIPSRNFQVRNGNGIASILKTGTSGLTDTYTITYTDGSTDTIDVENGDGIVSIAKTGTSGVVDTYTITYKDAAPTTFDITNGNRIYSGIVIRGKQTNPTIFSTSNISNARPGDLYNNISEGSMYHCVSGGAPSVATWAYDFTITGSGGGARNIVDLQDVDINLPTSGQILQCVEVPDPLNPGSTIFNWVNADAETTYNPNSVAPISGVGVAQALDDYCTEIEVDNKLDEFTDSVLLVNGTFTFNNLNPNYGYELCLVVPDNTTGELTIPEWTKITKAAGTLSGTISLAYTMTNVTGTPSAALRILK